MHLAELDGLPRPAQMEIVDNVQGDNAARNVPVPPAVPVHDVENVVAPLPAQHSETAMTRTPEQRLPNVNRPWEVTPSAVTMAQVIQQTTPVMMTMVAQALDHHLKVHSQTTTTGGGTPRLTKMTTPATLSLEFHDGMETLREKASQFKIGCKDYFAFYKTEPATWTTHAYHWLSGRLKRTYTSAFE